MSNKSIIISLIIFLVLSLGYLAYIQTKQQSIENQNFWIVYFSDFKDNSLNFVIENNGNEENFNYKIFAEEILLKEASVEIEKGAKKEINFDIEKKGKISVRVNAGNENQEVYKIIEKGE